MAKSSKVPPWRGVFLRALAECGNVTRAADAAGINVTQVYRVREREAEFAAALEAARAEGQARVLRHAQDGRVGVLRQAQDERGPGPGEVVQASRAGPGLRKAGWNRWSPARRETFLATLAATGNAARAAADCGLSTTAVYKRRHAEPGFAKDWEAALAAAAPRLRDHLTAAAIAAWDPEQAAIPDLPPVSFGEGLKLAQWIEARVLRQAQDDRARAGPAAWEAVDVMALRTEVAARVAAMSNQSGG